MAEAVCGTWGGWQGSSRSTTGSRLHKFSSVQYTRVSGRLETQPNTALQPQLPKVPSSRPRVAWPCAVAGCTKCNKSCTPAASLASLAPLSQAHYSMMVIDLHEMHCVATRGSTHMPSSNTVMALYAGQLMSRVCVCVCVSCARSLNIPFPASKFGHQGAAAP